MSRTQKTIKYMAIAFALFLTLNIISVIISGFVFIGNIFSDKHSSNTIDIVNELDIDDDVKLLNIDIKSSNVLIKIGDKFKAETSSKYIKCKKEKNMIYITEKNYNFFNNSNKSKLIIYIPEDIILDDVEINSGSGKVEIEKLKTKILDLDLGAGKVNIDNLTVLNNTKIEGVAGKVTVKNSSLNNLDLDIGIGKFTLEARILGSSKINHGVGSVILNLMGTKDDYQIHVNKGVGKASINSKNISDGETVGNGINKIDIDGGIGSIHINFNE